jgi:hypothetical protein
MFIYLENCYLTLYFLIEKNNENLKKTMITLQVFVLCKDCAKNSKTSNKFDEESKWISWQILSLIS